MSVTLTGLGACKEVGRSSFLLDFGEKILFDSGLKVTPDKTEMPLPLHTNVDAAILSHAHLDHSGFLPHLFLKSNSLCYMTRPTLDIAEILWYDTIKIAGYEGQDPPFNESEIDLAKKFSFGVGYNRKLNITKNASLEFFDAGHILGSALCKLDFDNKSILYTGDFNPDETRLHAGADLNVGKVDYVLSESTYGDRNHPPRKDVEKALVAKINEGLENNGTILLPSFAVGRTQEIVDILNDYNVNAPIFLDGMGQKVSLVYLRYPEYLKDSAYLKNSLKNVEWVKSDRDRRKALEEPSVIVATAGMLAGGPALRYIKTILDDPKSKVLLTGYQVEKTPGRMLIEEKRMFIDEVEYKAECDVQRFDFSAHGSQESMIRAYKKWNPEKIVLVHGDPKVMQIFKDKIEQDLGINTMILDKAEVTKLD